MAPTAGVVHPVDGERDTNVVPAGSVSLQLKNASSGPARFPAVIVYWVSVPAVLVSERTAFVMPRSAVPVIVATNGNLLFVPSGSGGELASQEILAFAKTTSEPGVAAPTWYVKRKTKLSPTFMGALKTPETGPPPTKPVKLSALEGSAVAISGPLLVHWKSMSMSVFGAPDAGRATQTRSAEAASADAGNVTMRMAAANAASRHTPSMTPSVSGSLDSCDAC